MPQLNVLVTGGAGYIGAHLVQHLKRDGYFPLVIDNGVRPGVRLPASCLTGCIGDAHFLEGIFKEHSIDAVIHLAALTDIGASFLEPLKYYQNNVAHTLILLECMQKYQVPHLIFSSSAGIFGVPDEVPIQESAPFHPISPYGRTKLMVEEILADCEHSFGLKYVALRYFNAAGASLDGSIRIGQRQENNLIPLLLQQVLSGERRARIFGNDYPTKDGTCVRDYVHVVDLARAHLLALEFLRGGGQSQVFNLGAGRGFSVLEVIRAVEVITGSSLDREILPRRIGDPAILVADFQKAVRLLGWSPEHTDLNEMVLHQWRAII
ncbi:MAG: UDP-glucose 4-epimerase [Chlamydiales bacterium]|jgi:UDP-glucose 4-epimerase|nr:UDP-glucose 4-epimerase [Chlamydiales bacterium]